MSQPAEPVHPKKETSQFTFQQNQSLYEPSKDEVRERLKSVTSGEQTQQMIPKIFQDWELIDPLSKTTSNEFNKAILEVQEKYKANFNDKIKHLPNYRVSKR